MRTGGQTHVYEVVDGWGTLPEHIAYGKTHGIVTDSADHVYVFHTGTPSVVKFDKDGRYIEAWGEQFAGSAHGFYLHRESGGEVLYVTDTARGVVAKLTLSGEELLRIEAPNLPDVYDERKKYAPTDVAVGVNGDIYIADGYGQHYIHQYSSAGNYIRSWGGEGSEPGKLKCPHGISVDLRHEEPELYVADRGNYRIQVFTPDGKHKRFIADDMDRPCSFYYEGEYLLFPDLHSRVTIFDRNDRLVTHLGEDQQAYKQPGWPNLPQAYFRPGKFSSPHGVCVDSEGSVYVAEWMPSGRVTKLARCR